MGVAAKHRSLHSIKTDGLHPSQYGWKRVWYRDFTQLANATLNSADTNTNVILGDTWTVHQGAGNGGAFIPPYTDSIKTVNGSGIEFDFAAQNSDLSFVAQGTCAGMHIPIANLADDLANYAGGWNFRLWACVSVDTVADDLDLIGVGWASGELVDPYGCFFTIGQFDNAASQYANAHLQRASIEQKTDVTMAAADATTFCIEKGAGGYGSFVWTSSSTSTTFPDISALTERMSLGLKVSTSPPIQTDISDTDDKIWMTGSAVSNGFKGYIRAMAIDIPAGQWLAPNP